MPKHTFVVNGRKVTVDVADDVRLLWVLRDILGITGPKYGCGINVCKACTSHLNGKAFNPCAVPVGQLGPDDEVTTIEGLPKTVGKKLHPMQQSWIENDVAASRDDRSPTPTSTRSATSAVAAPTPACARRSGTAPRRCADPVPSHPMDHSGALSTGLSTPCPCGSGASYDGCCGALHRGERVASTAEELMRSRYAAYVVGDGDHLFRTWHPRTRPDDLAPDPSLTWMGLEVVDVVAGGPDDVTGEVAFRASYRGPDGPGVLVERSSFERRAGRWVYVDGVLD